MYNRLAEHFVIMLFLVYLTSVCVLCCAVYKLMAEQKSGLSLQETVSFVKSRQHHISISKHKSTQEEVMESREEDEDELLVIDVCM